jgi:ABC-type multidrug transport system ATPase subunit
MAILETRALRKEFGALVAVHGLDLAIDPGEVFGLLGPNGAGKTTAILMMSALFTSMYYGLYIVWDRKIDVLKEILVSPVSRIAIFFGKVLGGCMDVAN